MNYDFDSDRCREFPPMVYVSILNVCNLNCIHCHYKLYSKRPDFHANMMSWEVWTKVVDEIADHDWSFLNLGTDGEPLVHKNFVEMMRYARKKGLYPLNITTNGLLLEGNLAEAIVKEGLLDIINISMDAFTAPTYKKIRGADFERLVRNVHNLIDLRNLYNPELRIQVNMIDQPEAHDEVEPFRNYWEPLVDNVMVRTYYDSTHITGGTGPDQTGKEHFDKATRWPCQLLWRRITVGDDGTIRFCVDDWYNKTALGEIPNNTIKEIWQSEAYNDLREKQLNGKFCDIDFCAECTEWQGMRWDYDYFVAMEKMLGKSLLRYAS